MKIPKQSEVKFPNGAVQVNIPVHTPYTASQLSTLEPLMASINIEECSGCLAYGDHETGRHYQKVAVVSYFRNAS